MADSYTLDGFMITRLNPQELQRGRGQRRLFINEAQTGVMAWCRWPLANVAAREAVIVRPPP